MENKESTRGREKKTSVPPIHVCVHSLRDNGCEPGDIEIASVKLTYLSVYEEGRRVGGSPVGRVKHKSISLHSTASGENRQTTAGSNVSKVHDGWTLGTFVSTFLFALRNICVPRAVSPCR